MRSPIVFWDVDTQVDFMEPGGALYVRSAEKIEPNLARLTEAARRLSIPVIASADDHQPADPEISSDPDFETTFPPHCMRGTRGARRVEATRLDWTLELRHEPTDPAEIRRALDASWPRLLLHKKELDVFSNPNTKAVLAALDAGRIVVYGVALDFCVQRFVDGLLDHGTPPEIAVVTDATRAIDARRGDQLLERWETEGARLETTDQLLRYLKSAPLAALG